MKYRTVFVLWLIMMMFCELQLLADSSKQNKIFPLPENLKPNIKFWISIYSKYDEHQYIIHDSWDLDIIYEVINLNDIFFDGISSEKRKWKEINKIKDEYRKILNDLGQKKNINPNSLTSRERHVYKLFKHEQNPDVFTAAASNVRAQQGLKGRFKKGVTRSGKYMPKIIEIFKKYDLPLELTALPHVESSFDIKAYSKFGAAGLWQFMRGTGRLYLKINYTVDERFDPIKATEAAAKLLKNNYEELGKWPLAITAYNHGVNGIKKAITKIGYDDIGEITKSYSNRQFGFASRNFYAEFLAALHISKNYKKYFGELEFEKPVEYLVVELPYYVKISSLKKQLNLSIQEIKEYNPSLRSSVLKSQRRLPKGFILHIPMRKDFELNNFYAQFPGSEKLNQQVKSNWYEVKKGDNLKKIANIFNTSVEKIIALNVDIQNNKKIYVNQIIRLPQQETGITPSEKQASTASVAQAFNKSESREKNKEDIKWYEVRKGESLKKIANRFGTSVDILMAINDINNKNQIYPGQLIRLPTGDTEATVLQKEIITAENFKTSDLSTKYDMKTSSTEEILTNYWYDVKPGDNLKKIADRFNVSVTELVKINHIENTNLLRIGQTLIIPPTQNNLQQQTTSSMLANSSATKFYKVQPGDNLEKIAAYYNVTVKNLMQINNLKNKNKLYAGQNLIIPYPESQLVLSEIEADYFSKTTKTVENTSKIAHHPSNKIKKPLPVDKTSFSINDKIYVLPDETLGHFADWLEIPTQKLRDLNGLTFNQDIQLSQELKIIYVNVRKEEFLQKRMEYHRGLEEDFFSSYNVSGVQTHKLKKGENIWYLCNEVYEVPYWLVVKYNPNIDLNRLIMGDEIIIPIITLHNEN